MKKILGLDIGTNSIGWALINTENKKILGIGSRIIPMGTDKSDYEKGVGITKNADRRMARGIRKMNKRFKIRRNKLLFILNEIGCLPDQFQFKNGIPEPNKLQDMELFPIAKGTLQLDSLQQVKLNVKALRDKVGLKELGKILYRFNQLRGYSGGANEEKNKKTQIKNDVDDENDTKKNYEIAVEKIELVRVEKSEDTFKTKNEDLNFYNISVIYQDQEIEGKTRLQNLSVGEQELEIRIKRNKKGEESYEFALPRKTNWRKQMESTEDVIRSENIFVSELLLKDLQNKWNKIRNRVVLRNRYKQEFDAIWDTQYNHNKNEEFRKIVDNKELLEKIILYIFPERDQSKPETDESKKSQKEKLREEARTRGLKYLIKEQVIYYQRSLKPQTDLISKCQFEKEEKVLAISHPLFQEFRCWDQINRLYLTSKSQVFNEKKKKYQYQYTNRFLTNQQKQDIYDKLQKQKQVGFNDVAKIVQLKNDTTEYLNGLNVKAKLKGSDTLLSIKKIIGEYFGALKEKDENIITNLWDILYSKTGNEYDETSEIVAPLIKILSHHLNEEIATSLSLKLAQNVKFPRKYSSLSGKAINNILPLMQLNPSNLPEKILVNISNIQHLIETGEILDENLLEDYVISFVNDNPNFSQTGGLMYAFASSLVYGKHTQQDVKKEITDYHQIKYNPNRNLRNPIVEQLSNEVMQVIKALWKKYKLDPNDWVVVQYTKVQI